MYNNQAIPNVINHTKGAVHSALWEYSSGDLIYSGESGKLFIGHAI